MFEHGRIWKRSGITKVLSKAGGWLLCLSVQSPLRQPSLWRNVPTLLLFQFWQVFTLFFFNWALSQITITTLTSDYSLPKCHESQQISGLHNQTDSNGQRKHKHSRYYFYLCHILKFRYSTTMSKSTSAKSLMWQFNENLNRNFKCHLLYFTWRLTFSQYLDFCRSSIWLIVWLELANCLWSQ